MAPSEPSPKLTAANDFKDAFIFNPSKKSNYPTAKLAPGVASVKRALLKNPCQQEKFT